MTEKRGASFIPKASALLPRLRRALRGEVDAFTLAREALRRSRVALERDRERARLDELDKSPARLNSSFKRMSGAELLNYFRERTRPHFLPGFSRTPGAEETFRRLFPVETERLVGEAARVRDEHAWPLLGFGERRFGREIQWRRDPLSGYEWPLEFHADITFARGDGSDVRVVWELNRLNHLVRLALAYRVTRDEDFSREFFAQIESWRESNPVARGPNWACAMEVALRSINLLAAFEIFRHSAAMTEERLSLMLKMFDQHGAHIRRNLEFSYIATSNHYLSDVVGLLWLGVMLPELEEAEAWRTFALKEMLREMDKQVLADGADFEASTGYHRLVLELFLYSFLLCRENSVHIEERYWQKLRGMFEYLAAIVRPDGRAPLVGDTDSGRVLPIRQRAADDHAFLLSLGAAVFQEPRFKTTPDAPEELFWIQGSDGVRAFESLACSGAAESSRGFADAGTYVLRAGDLYLLFNASGVGARGRGSHGHNDALSLEVSACGTSFIRDPGTYVYTADLGERNLFRSTAYHSTVEVDGEEQNTTNRATPFVLGDEAHPRVTRWESASDADFVSAEHSGYARLREPVRCARLVRFDKRRRYWLVEDAFEGAGEHTFRFRFHLAPGLTLRVRDEMLEASCEERGARLVIAPLDSKIEPLLEERFSSNDYGAKRASFSACWTLHTQPPFKTLWAIVPVCAGEALDERLGLIEALRKIEEG